MKQNIKIAILGGGGRTGKVLVHQLINHGYSCRLLLRNPENLQIESPLIEIVKGDACDANAINSVLKGCNAVISTIGQRAGEPLVAELATKNVLAAMALCDIKRYLLVAGINIHTPSDKKSVQTIAATEWMKKNYPIIQEDRQNAYSLLVASNVDWTLLRVPFIEFAESTGAVTENLEDCLGTKINAGNIAAFLVKQLFEETYFRKAPFIANA
jgi:putative NADH-flavin reductase